MIDAYTIVRYLKAPGFDECQTKGHSVAIQNLKSDFVTKEYLQAYLEAAMEKHLAKYLLSQILIAGVIIVAIKLATVASRSHRQGTVLQNGILCN